jgi:hypothetical protein
MNSISTLIVHMLASEAELLRSVLGLPHSRHREAEFGTQSYSCDHLLRLLDAADADLETLGPRLTEQDLQASSSWLQRQDCLPGILSLSLQHLHRLPVVLSSFCRVGHNSQSVRMHHRLSVASIMATNSAQHEHSLGRNDGAGKYKQSN